MQLSHNPLIWSAQTNPSLTNSYAEPTDYALPSKTEERKSFIRSPIPTDPGYGDRNATSRNACDYYRAVRLHGSDAKVIYRRAIAQTGVPFFLDFPRATNFNKSTTKENDQRNHMNENLKRIRRIMRETRKREETKTESKKLAATKALWQSKKYDHVESKVKQRLKEETDNASSRPQSVQSNYLRAHQKTVPELKRSQSAADLRRASIGSVADATKVKPDYIKINSEYAKSNPKMHKSMTEETFQKAKEDREKKFQKYQERQKGRLPDYVQRLIKARNQAIHEAHLNAPDPECPPGHVKIDEKQRVTTLAQLESNRAELEKKLCHLPIRNDSVTLRRTKDAIEKKIVELDEAIKIFSKSKVFLQLDE